MRRAARLAQALAVVALTGVTLAGAALARSSPPRGTAVGIGEREWRITVYRPRVPAGVVRFNVRNFGEDGHNLGVRNRHGRVLGVLPEVRPGGVGTLRLRLRRNGRYTLFCSLEGHEQRGMRARLRVVKPRRR